MKNAAAIAVGRSTPGLEALLGGKPVLTLVKSDWYYEILSYEISDFNLIDLSIINQLASHSLETICDSLSQVLYPFDTDPYYVSDDIGHSSIKNTITITSALKQVL